MQRPDLRALPPTLRVLCAGFLSSLGLAYAVALLFVFVQSGMQPKGISEQFRGNAGETPGGEAPGGEVPANGAPGGDVQGSEVAQGDVAQSDEAHGGRSDAAEEALPGLGREWKTRDQGMKFPKPFKEMILTTHLHLLSISGILLMVGAIFACSSFPERAKPWIIAAGFAGLGLDYACMWGVRYVSGAFSSGVFAFGLLQSLSLALQIIAGLRDLLFPGVKGISARSQN